MAKMTIDLGNIQLDNIQVESYDTQNISIFTVNDDRTWSESWYFFDDPSGDRTEYREGTLTPAEFKDVLKLTEKALKGGIEYWGTRVPDQQTFWSQVTYFDENPSKSTGMSLHQGSEAIYFSDQKPTVPLESYLLKLDAKYGHTLDWYTA